ncbi:malto-oligosyltrehalose synthase [Acidiferrimicrobium sp. IK]|uniref:malto-oligosyltrehalose synthase n=1 Tax=Acidiferrimicrobium sp. IK TaxID=2871700 RepID=UPI0039678488
MHAGFTFDDAAGIAGYLSELGVSHLYLSPVLQAAPGSTHGYDVVDPTRVNRELGGEEGHRRLQAALQRAGLGQLLDIVPNHMAITGRDNAWWWDVLENGPASVYASYFDVDWDPPESKLRNTVLLPILGDHYGRELEAGRLAIEREGGGFVLRYFDHAAPLTPRSLDDILVPAAVRLDDPAVRGELESLASAFAKLPLATLTDPDSVRERHRDKEILRNRLATLVVERPAVGEAISEELEALNRDPDRLDALLDRQNFRLAWWRTAGEELDYRRFFDINDLAGIRVEDPAVFADSHQLILAWLRDGVIDGVRIDHVDGLRDPATYLDRLRSAAPEAWVVVEKILEGDEALPGTWMAAGTTGYDWLNVVAGVLEDAEGDLEIQASYRSFSGVTDRFEEMVHQAKVEVLDGPLAADLNRLAARLTRICEHHRRYRDYTRRDLRDALGAVLVAFPVYRTYVRPGHPAEDTDVAVVDSAVMTAGVRHPEIDDELLGFIRDLLLLRVPGEDERELALRFQQTSGPVMAKALEDTAFYRWVPTSWRNEVGGDPGRPPGGPGAFHEHNASVHAAHPLTLLATSTHDTKRSEDVRARLSILAEQPAMWASVVERWCEANAGRDAPPPDRSTEWLLYQTLVGAWPIDAARLKEYMGKATREAKLHTSWTDPDEFYDSALEALIDEMLADAAFVADVDAVVERIRRPGWAVALGQKLLTLTAPGVPDLYQGSESWDLSLVDPDNRRPVDYAKRRRLLERARAVLPGEVGPGAGRDSGGAGGPDEPLGVAALWAEEQGEGTTKVAVVHAALAVRADRPEAFGPGAAGRYSPLVASGPAAAHIVGFCRGGQVISLATRLPTALDAGGGWRGTTLTLPPGRWIDRLTGAAWEGTVALGEMLSGLPVALLVADRAAPGEGPMTQDDGQGGGQ